MTEDGERSALLGALYGQFLAFATRLSGNRADGTELASVALISIMSRWTTLKSRPNFPGFLKAYGFAVIRNAHSHTARTQRRMQPAEIAEISRESSSALDKLIADEERIAVREAVARLDRTYRDVVLAALSTGLDGLAKEQGVSNEAVRQRLIRAVRKLRADLTGRPEP